MAKTPAPIGLAVAASCAIPLGFEPIQITLPDGRVLFAFDGSMTEVGAIPLAAFAAVMGETAGQHLILDVGEEQGWKGYVDSTLYRLLCGGKCIPRWNKFLELLKLPRTGTESAPSRTQTYLQVNVTEIAAIDFNANADRKWAASAECFRPIISGLGLLTAKSLAGAEEMAEKLRRILTSKPQAAGQLAASIQEVFIAYGLYKPDQEG